VRRANELRRRGTGDASAMHAVPTRTASTRPVWTRGAAALRTSALESANNLGVTGSHTASPRSQIAPSFVRTCVWATS